MAQASLTPHQQRINDAQNKGKELIYGILIGISLVLIAIWIGLTLFSDTEGYLTNVFTEVISVIATIFVIDRINQWRDDQRLKNQLLEELKSSSTSPAVNALDRLRREGWLNDDYFVGKDLQRADWEGAYIGELNFENAIFDRVNFRGVSNYKHNDNSPINFSGTSLWGANLSNSHLVNANIMNANLATADLTNIDLRNANLSDIYLESASLVKANLWGANLKNADLGNANLTGADLTGVNLTGADTYGANFTNTNLRNANLEGADLWFSDLEGANLQGTNLLGANLENVNLNAVTWKAKDNISSTIEVILPDGRKWTPDIDLECFTNSEHHYYQIKLGEINSIRINLGYEPIF